MSKYLGLVRKLDNLGRVVIPKEYRKVLNWEDGDRLEIIAVPEDNGVLVRKYKRDDK